VFVLPDGTVAPIARSDKHNVNFILNLSSVICFPRFEHQQFISLFCRAALGNTPQAAYSRFPLQSAGEFCGCVQQKWKDFG
jgi:hypothetical protein